MSRLLATLASALLLLCATSVLADNPKVRMETSKGPITIELYPDKSPKTVENFLVYVNEGFYDGTIFHRVIEDFMIQGGGFTEDMQKKPTHDPIQNEADNGLENERGTIAMARTGDPHSATAQFFINHKDNDFLNHSGKNPRGWGYTVFGKVTDGMEVVDEIAATPTGAKAPFPQDVPQTTILIEKVSRIDG
jgi:cyclophilin family peptidyl-prolyl cis-trans isomerase